MFVNKEIRLDDKQSEIGVLLFIHAHRNLIEAKYALYTPRIRRESGCRDCSGLCSRIYFSLSPLFAEQKEVRVKNKCSM